jgi:hypothetical protein
MFTRSSNKTRDVHSGLFRGYNFEV